MHPEFQDILRECQVESPQYKKVREFKVQAYEMHTEVCRSLYTKYGSQRFRSNATPSPFLHCCRSIECAVRMRDEAQTFEDAGTGIGIKARFRPNENHGLPVIVRIDIVSMLEDREMLGVIDMSSEEAADRSL